jgi:hypothetical protein
MFVRVQAVKMRPVGFCRLAFLTCCVFPLH